MHHSYRNRPIVGGPRLFDAQVLEMLGQVRRAGGCDELGDGEFEGVGELFEVVDTHIDLPPLDLADVRPMKPGQLGQDLLRPAAGEP